VTLGFYLEPSRIMNNGERNAVFEPTEALVRLKFTFVLAGYRRDGQQEVSMTSHTYLNAWAGKHDAFSSPLCWVNYRDFLGSRQRTQAESG